MLGSEPPLFPKREKSFSDKNLQGSFRRYVKRDFFELNSIFTHGRKPGMNAGTARAPVLTAGLNRTNLQGGKDGDEGGSKPSVSHYRVDSVAELPVKIEERELLGEVCSSTSSKFAARSLRVNQMLQVDKLRSETKKGDAAQEPQCEAIVRLCFWYVFLIAWQPEDVDLAKEFGRLASNTWQRVRTLADAEAVDLFAAIFCEAVFQAFPRAFPGSRPIFDDSFSVFLFQALFHLLFGISIAPTAVHEMRTTYFPTFLRAFFLTMRGFKGIRKIRKEINRKVRT
jgi:hypothetical protein